LWPDAIEPTEELIKEIKKGIRTVKNYPPIDVDNLPRVYVRPALSGIEEPTMIAIEPRKDEDGQTGKGDKSTSKDGDPKKAKAKPVEQLQLPKNCCIADWSSLEFYKQANKLLSDKTVVSIKAVIGYIGQHEEPKFAKYANELLAVFVLDLVKSLNKTPRFKY
jgi:hypothetical protein